MSGLFQVLCLCIVVYLRNVDACGDPVPWGAYQSGPRWLLYHLPKEAATYEGAKQKCENLGGSLATLGMRIESIRKLIEMDMLDSRRPDLKLVYIGLDELDEAGSWKWIDGQKAGSETNWVPGEPNISTENCAMMVGDYNWKYWDTTCSEKHRFLCEIVVE